MKLRISQDKIPQHLRKFFKPIGHKSKDLISIPFLVAEALREDGWWLRSDVVWSKPNPLPESITDRPSKSHEYVFMLAKAEKYFYDQDSVREKGSAALWNSAKFSMSEGKNQIILEQGNKIRGTNSSHPNVNRIGRNLQTVWVIPTQGYTEVHFATFPEELVRRCICAGTSLHGCCSKCFSPWKRIVEVLRGQSKAKLSPFYERETTGWQPTCKCDTNERIPCTVLDPFAGTGTTGLVAAYLGRNSILIELQKSYIPLIEKRLSEVALTNKLEVR